MTRSSTPHLTAAALALAAGAVFAVGCDTKTTQTGTDNPPGHSDDDEHGHGDGAHAHTFEPMTIAGRTVTLSMGGDVEPGEEAHLDVKVEGDPVDAVRVWIGYEDGVDALKEKLDDPAGGHVHLDAPEDIEGLRIVVELEVGDETHVGSVAIPEHEHEGHDGDDGHDADHDDAGGHDHDGDGEPDH